MAFELRMLVESPASHEQPEQTGSFRAKAQRR
jgi:hypothetical protein